MDRVVARSQNNAPIQVLAFASSYVRLVRDATFERAGYRLLGFFPGYDRVEVTPGVVKRVYQAAYAKLLAPEDEIHWPDPKNMTPRAQALYALLFSGNAANPAQ